ncbi:putative gamma-glutamylcyclotransferase CG2811 [Battus philenor]|uniref:putative gamma-glutamylcyclotransferase CG2811 n=1 Tax=Battus philenor TaxID=42288 RepID=UPI0035D11AC5
MTLITTFFIFQGIRKRYCNYLIRMINNVFVYGTLKRNEPNHHWISDPKNGISKFISNGKTSEKYPLIIATKYNIPFILYKPGVGYQVQGEVYEVDDNMLAKLDILEDHPNYYIREIDNVEIMKSDTNETQKIKCWIYFLKNFKEELLSRQMLENYSSSGSHGMPYLESNNESTIDDINEDDVKVK